MNDIFVSITVRIWDGGTATSLCVIFTEILISDLAFSADGSHLQTNIGRLDFESAPDISFYESARAPNIRLHGDCIFARVKS